MSYTCSRCGGSGWCSPYANREGAAAWFGVLGGGPPPGQGDEPCKKCGGTGEIGEEGEEGTPIQAAFEKCPDCGGTGKSSENEEQSEAMKWFQAATLICLVLPPRKKSCERCDGTGWIRR